MIQVTRRHRDVELKSCNRWGSERLVLESGLLIPKPTGYQWFVKVLWSESLLKEPFRSKNFNESLMRKFNFWGENHLIISVAAWRGLPSPRLSETHSNPTSCEGRKSMRVTQRFEVRVVSRCYMWFRIDTCRPSMLIANARSVYTSLLVNHAFAIRDSVEESLTIVMIRIAYKLDCKRERGFPIPW